MRRGIVLILVLWGPWLMAQEPVLSVGVAVGYERQDFRWSIAGNPAGQDPNVYSELKWHGVGGVSGRVDLRWKVWGRWRVFANGSGVSNKSGTLGDTDYGLDNRHDILYHEQFAVKGGYSEAGAVGAGFCLLDGPGFRLVPFAGFRISKQYFPIVGEGGPFAGLNSYYSAKWLGPFLKVEAAWQPAKRWRVGADVVYDQVVYRGVADWNLIADFSHPVSFRHRADGYGVEGEVRVGYMLGKHLELLLAGDYFDWETGTGIDMLYLNTGAAQQTQLNGVVRHGVGGRLGVAWGF
jgi:hypothetical protein